VIPFPFNPDPGSSPGPRLNGEGGFPHSEICGSKVAHTSPQLIAACHVLHRLCMPRHPPNALTSRLRVHTTNDKADRRRMHPYLAVERMRRRFAFVPDALWIILLSIFNQFERICPTLPRRRKAWQKQMHPASISRTHLQCQSRGQIPLYRGYQPRISYLHSWKIVVSLNPRARQSQQSCALWRASQRWPCLVACELASLIRLATLRIGGAYRDRTDDLMLAKQPLSQLS
jgi:hypothetical protein